jgi:hypothetical protein
LLCLNTQAKNAVDISYLWPFERVGGIGRKKAVALSKAEWETDKVPTNQPNRKKESESDDIGTKKRRRGGRACAIVFGVSLIQPAPPAIDQKW